MATCVSEEGNAGDSKCMKTEASNICRLEATVVTGFETVARDECKEKFDIVATVERGRIFFDIPVSEAHKVLNLRSIDNLYVVIKIAKVFEFPDDKELVYKRLCNLIYDIDWATGLKVWKQVTNYKQRTLEELFTCGDEINKQILNDKNDNAVSEIPKFRATCYRSGQNHCFTSMEAAAKFGGAINDHFHWKVDMKHHDIEVVLNITDNSLYVCIALTKESLHCRNLEHFGPTSLRATIAYNLVRLCSIKPQDIVCDPMCGGGSISIEAALNWPNSFHLCGDIHSMAWSRTLQNIQAVNKKLTAEDNSSSLQIDIFQWDACHMPLRDNSVDVIVTDLPFGKRLGSKTDNRKLYPKFLEEMARVCKMKSGRAILLTHDKKSMSQAVGRCSSYWRQTRVLGVNIGGLAACVYILNRTARQPIVN